MFSRILKILYHFTVYAVGVLVLLAAVAVTLVRLVLPDIGIYRSEVQAWVSQYMGFPIVFHSIDANWQGWIPELTLTDIDLLNRAGTETITHFDKARITIAPVATVVQRQFIPRSLTISGFELTIIRQQDGSISVQDIEIQGVNTSSTGNSELAEWLFKQDEIEILNAEITWVDHKYKQEEPIQLTGVNFKMRNDIGRFQVDGSAGLPASFGTTLDFAFDAFGNLMTSEWSGELFLSAADINPDNWYRNIRPIEFNLTGGHANIEVWMNWNRAKLERLEGKLQYDDFEAMVQDSPTLSLNTITALFRGSRSPADAWQFDVRLRDLMTQNGEWPDTDLSILREPLGPAGHYRYTTSYSYLKINDLKPVLAKLNLLPVQARDFLDRTTLEGELSDGRITYDPDPERGEIFSFSTSFRHLSTDFGDELPAFTGLAGNISGSPAAGRLLLEDSSATYVLPASGGQRVDISELVGDLEWRRSGDLWTVTTNSFSLKTDDLSVNLFGSVSRDAGHAPFLDLVVNIGQTDLATVAGYLPQTDKFRLKSWMDRALLGGTVNTASGLFRGSLDDFPFDKHEGQFQVHADISNATLEYAGLWPVADQLYGEVNLDGRDLTAEIQSGNFYNTEINGATVRIENIYSKQKSVDINGHIRGGVRDLALFIEQSPLDDHATLGELRTAMRSGDFGLDLDLSIPLGQPGTGPGVKGSIRFTDAVIDSTAMKMHIARINGNVEFDRDTVSSGPITGEYMQQPVTIALSGSRDDPENPYTVTLAGESGPEFFLDRIAEYVPAVESMRPALLQRLSGNTAWQADLHYTGNDDTGHGRSIVISSDLKGLEMRLPDPLGKRMFATVPLTVSTVINQDPVQEISFDYNGEIKGQFILDRNESEKMLQQVAIQIGEAVASNVPERKFNITGTMDYLPVREWIDFMGDLAGGENRHHPVMDDIGIDLEVAYLDLFGHEYVNVLTVGSRTDWGWSFNLDGEAIKGDAYMPETTGEEKILTLMLDRLEVEESAQRGPGGGQVNPADLPILAVEVNEFIHKGRNLGRFTLQSSRIHNGISLDQIEFYKDNLVISGNGSWLNDGENENSKFNIEVHADELNTLLSALGYDQESVEDGETDFRIIADWFGSPLDFQIENLNGRLDIAIRDGHLLDVNPSAGRLFGLLSFHTLPRRLLLDFRDLFSKGMSFDKIEGSFDIANGNAYTNNLFMDSPAADVAISGRTGLADQDYDQIVTVTPQITESIPVAGAIFGPVGIGVGAVIYLVGEMFNSLNENVDGIIQYQYSITGSWSDPIIRKLKENDVIAGG